MVLPLLIGVFTLAANMAIQVYTAIFMLRLLQRRLSRARRGSGWSFDSGVVSGVLLFLYTGLMFQIAVWALLFKSLGEFDDFETAFYYSAVNFATLGYGDIVMSERWRLLGPLEASSGALMFGLSASMLFTVMSLLFRHNHSLPPGERRPAEPQETRQP